MSSLCFGDYANSPKYPETTATGGNITLYVDGIAQTPQYSKPDTANAAAVAASQKMPEKTVVLKYPDVRYQTVWRSNTTYSSSSASNSSSSQSSNSRSSSSSNSRNSGVLVRLYNNIPNIQTSNVDTLEELDSLPGFLDLNQPNSSITYNNPPAPAIAVDSAIRLTFYIYLNKSDSIRFVSTMDDSLFLSIDGVPFHKIPFDNWGVKSSPVFTPNESRFYLVDWIVYNGISVGQLIPSISINGVSQSLSAEFYRLESPVLALSSSSRATSNTSSSSRASSSGVRTATLTWEPPKERENGQLLPIGEIGGYEIRQQVNSSYQYIKINDAMVTKHTFTYFGGDVEIAVFDISGLYSDFTKASR